MQSAEPTHRRSKNLVFTAGGAYPKHPASRFQKRLQACKPDSVPPPGGGLRHLSGSAGHPGNLRCLPPWPARRTGARGASNAAPETRAPGVHGISTREVYPPPDLRRDAVRSYRTFSPLPRKTRRLFSVTRAVFRLSPEPHLLGGTVLCVVRTFLPIMRRQSGLQSYLLIGLLFFRPINQLQKKINFFYPKIR